MFVMLFTFCTYAQWSIVTLRRGLRLRSLVLYIVGYVVGAYAQWLQTVSQPLTAVDCLSHDVLRELHIFSHLLGNKNKSQGI